MFDAINHSKTVVQGIKQKFTVSSLQDSDLAIVSTNRESAPQLKDGIAEMSTEEAKTQGGNGTIIHSPTQALRIFRLLSMALEEARGTQVEKEIIFAMYQLQDLVEKFDMKLTRIKVPELDTSGSVSTHNYVGICIH